MIKPTASATLIFYNCSFIDRIRGYNLNPPRDIVSVAPFGKEYEKIGRIWQIKGRIHFVNERSTIEEIADDFSNRFSENGIMMHYDGRIDIEIPLSQRPIIIPAFVNYFTQNDRLKPFAP
jgi:hypothetical protein